MSCVCHSTYKHYISDGYLQTHTMISFVCISLFRYHELHNCTVNPKGYFIQCPELLEIGSFNTFYSTIIIIGWTMCYDRTDTKQTKQRVERPMFCPYTCAYFLHLV